MTACWGWLPPWTWSSAWALRDACRHRGSAADAGVRGSRRLEPAQVRFPPNPGRRVGPASRAAAWRSGSRVSTVFQQVHLVDQVLPAAVSHGLHGVADLSQLILRLGPLALGICSTFARLALADSDLIVADRVG